MAPKDQPVTIYHNPNCGSSNNALKIADELGVHADIVLYLKTPPDAEALRGIIAKLEDPVTDLVRRDAAWDKLGLTDADAVTEDQVVDLLVQHKQLLQRPIVIKGEVAIIGRPKDRVRELLS
ncbi:MAG: arsenate reductase [Ilumatobacteraceae bacterium]|nr:arsenate reductase [Ilumatobacteraceae bacterium]